MTKQEALLVSIIDEPDDINIRLIYADYLMEHGNEIEQLRGSFIQTQCDLTNS